MTNQRDDGSHDDDNAPPDSRFVAHQVPHSLYDPLLWEWRRLAAIAWGGYLESGAGHVVIEVDGEVHYRYLPGAPRGCRAELIDDYDPETQVVVAIHRDGASLVLRLDGWPKPPAAWAGL